MKNRIVYVYFFFNTALAYSQNYLDVIKVNLATTPYNKFDTGLSKTKINQIDADLTVPVKINKNFSLITGLINENIQTKLFENQNIKQFGSVTLKLGINQKFDDNWSGTMVLLPKVSSDHGFTEKKDFQMGVLTMMKFKKRENLNYKFGIYYNSELFGPFVAPVVGMYYLNADEKFEANLLLPLQADFSYKLFNRIRLGASFTGQVRTYHLKNITIDNKSVYLEKSSNEFFAYLKLNFSKNFLMQIKSGQSVGRSFKAYRMDDTVNLGLPAIFFGKKREPLNTGFADGMIFQLVLLYRFLPVN